MTLSCRACLFRSTDPAFFHTEPVGLFGRRLRFCEGCSALIGPNLTLMRATVGPLQTVGFFAMYILLVRTADNPWAYLQIAAFVAFVRLGRPATVLTHELGHALFGRLVGLEIPTIELGDGFGLRTVSLGASRIELRGLFFMGGSTHFVDLSPAPSRWRVAVGVAGGPLANGVATGLILAVATVLHIALLAHGIVAAALLGAGLSQGTAMLSSLWPETYAWGAPSDGRRLLDALKPAPASTETPMARRGRALLDLGRFNAAQQVYCEAVATCPEDPLLFSRPFTASPGRRETPRRSSTLSITGRGTRPWRQTMTQATSAS